MSWTSTLSGKLKNALLSITVIAITLLSANSYGQTKTYATVTPSTGLVGYPTLLGGVGNGNPNPGASAGSITNPGNAATGSDATYAALKANYFSLLVLGGEGEAWLQVKYPTTVSAGKTTYIRFDQPTTEGISLDLINLLGDLTGLLKQNLVQLDAYSGASSGGNGTLIPAGNVSSTIVKDAAGKYYFAVTSTQPYNSVRVRLRFSGHLLGLALGASINMKVYNAFTVADQNCAPSIFTNIGESTGLNVSLTDLLLDPERAIDGNINTYSTIQSGLVALGSTASQTVYLGGSSGAADYAKVTLSIPASVLNVDLFNTVTVQGYNGNTPVGTAQAVRNLLSLDLLGLLSNTKPIPVFFKPGAAFDRVKITLNNGLAVGGNILSGGLRVHEVQQTVEKPTFAGITGGAMSICGDGVTLSVNNPNPAFTYNWYRSTKDANTKVSLGAAIAGTYSDTNLAPGTYMYYVSAQKAGCTGESDLDSAKVTVTAVPTLPVVATVAPICVGSTATLTIPSPAAGVTYKWYTTATAGTALVTTGNGTTFTTPKLTENTTYYVEGTNGTCVSPTRTAVVVTVTLPPALAEITTQDVAISAGQTAVLTATAPAGITINWYSAAAGGILLKTDATYTTPVLNATKIYYVETVNETGCVSATRVPVTVTVLNGPTNPNCNAANRQLSGIDGICLLCKVQNPGNSVDNNFTNATTISIPVGIGGSGYQRLIFAGSGAATDSIRLDLGFPGGLADATVLGGIEVRVMNAGSVVKTYKLNSLLDVKLLNSSRFKLTVAAGGVYDRVEVRAVGLISALINLNIYGAEVVYPSPTVKAEGLAICAGNTTILTATAAGGTSLKWFADATGGTALSTTGTYTTPKLATTTTYYIEVSNTATGCANTERLPVKVTVTAIPTLPVVTTVDPICVGSTATLAISSPAAGITYKWYTTATAGTALVTTGNGATFTTPKLTETTTYYVEGTNGSCVSPTRTAVVVTVTLPPALAEITTQDVAISSGQTAVLTATAPAGVTINWYSAATGGILFKTGGTYTTPALNATTIYYVETVNATGCVSATRVPVTVTVVGGTANPNCNAANRQLSGIDGICVLCKVQNPGNSVDNNFTNATTISLPLGVGGSGYQRLIFAGSGAATDSIRLDLGFPGGLADATVLGGIEIRVMNANSVVKTYKLNSLLNLTVLSSSRFKLTVAAGGVYDRVEVRAVGLVSALINLNIYGAEVIYPNPTVKAEGLAICSGTTATLSATATGGTSIKWFANATGGTALSTTATYTTPKLTTTTTYYIEVSKGTCANADRIPVKVTVNPAIVFATTTLNNATVASVYSKQITVATGGTPAFTYALAPDSKLPAGLTLSAEGLITGTPTVAGSNSEFSIIATDSKGCIATADYTLTVTAPLSLPAKELPNGIVGKVYPTQTIPAAIGGTTPYTYVATDLPPGLTFNPTTREITGTPTKAGTYTIPVTATDANGNTVSRDYTIIVRDPLVLPAATLVDGTVGKVYPTQTIPSATGGQGPYTYVATDLPPGLSFDPATREITGTPTKIGTYTVPVKVTDADGNTVTTNYTIKVNDPLVLPAKPLADGTVGVVYVTETLPAATGGTAPYTYVATNLPPGLIFNPATRQITGTPTKSGTYNIGVTATDDSGATVSQNYALKVNGVLSLPTATLPDGLVGTAYPVQTLPAVTGGTAPYTYSATGIPEGLKFDPATRKITGTPTKGGTYNITMTATDDAGLSTSTDYALVVKVGAPIVAAATTCSGTSAILTVSNTIPGVVYNWYAATGNDPVGHGSSFTTEILKTNTTYYAEATSGTAVSSRTPVTVTLNPAPAQAEITTKNETISSGQTATLSATAPAGVTINWYSAATNGTLLKKGETFTTLALNITTTYYVETVNATGCVSDGRVPVTVTVTSGPANPNCNAATGQKTGIDGICALCSIEGPGNSTDDVSTNFTKINLAIGLGATGYQRLIFAHPGAATDSIRLDLATPVGLTDISVLGGITVRVMNKDQVVKTYPLNSSLLNLQLLSGKRFKATLAATGTYDRVEVRFGAVVAALSNLSIYGAEVIYPNPTVKAEGQTICAGSATTLSATANGGTTIKWFANATGGTALSSVGTYTTPKLATTTTYYIEVSNTATGCANKDRVPVKVTVTAIPAAPVVATVDPVCVGSMAKLTVDGAATGVTYSWFANATGGTALTTGASYTTPALEKTTTYYVEAANGSCVSATRTAVIATVNALPALAEITTQDVAISAGQTAVLTATAPAGVTINWYSAAAGGTLLKTGGTYTTPALNATKIYYVETVNATGCMSATRVPVTVTVLNGPANPNCNAANRQLSGIDGICVLCKVQNPGNSVDNNFTNATTISLPLGVGGSGYQRLIFAGSGLATDSIRMDLGFPGGLADATVLGGIEIGVMNANSVVKTYKLNSLLNLTVLSSSRFKLTVAATGVYDRVEVRAVGLVNALINLNIYGAEIISPSPTVKAEGQTICAGSATTLSATTNGGTSLKWFADATGGTALSTTDTYTTPKLTTTTTYYIEVTSASGCVSKERVPVKVTVTTAPAAPVVATVPPVCAGSGAIISVSNPVAGATYSWYATATGGTALATGSTFTTGGINADTTYYVEAANGNCVSATRTAVSVKVNPLPALPQIQASATTVSANQTAILSVVSADANITYNWYTSANSTTPVFTGPVYVTPPLLATTTYYLEAQSTATGCSAPSRVQVTINVNGGGNNPVPCESAATETHGVDGLSLLSGVFNSKLAVDNNAKTGSSLVMVVGLLQGSVYQRVNFPTLSNIGDTVHVLLSAPGKLLSAGVLSSIDVSTYNNNTSNNDGVSLGNSLIHLELLSGNTQALVTFVPTKQFNKIEVRIKSGVVGALTTVDLNYAQRVAVAPEVVAPDVTACASKTAVLEVKNPKAGITYKWYNAANDYQAGKDGAQFTTPALTANTTYYVTANTASGCESARTAVNITVTPIPAAPVLISSAVNTCPGTDVKLEVSNPLTGIVYKWYNEAGVYQAGKDGVTFTVTGVTATTKYSVEAVNACDIASATKTVATINVGNIDKPVITPASVTISAGSPAVLTATSGTVGVQFKWYDTESSTTALPNDLTNNADGARYVTIELPNTTKLPITKTYYVEASVPGGCTSARAAVVVTIIPNGAPTDVPCEAATVDVKHGVDGVALLTWIFNPELAVDNNAESASSLVMPVGALGASVYQQVGFTGGLSNVGDTVRVRLSSPGKLLSLELLSSLELTTFNKGTSNNDKIIVSNPLIHLELLSNDRGAILSYVPKKQFDGIEVRLRSGLASVLSTLDFHYAQRVIAAPTVESATVSACEGSAATLAIQNPLPGITYRWYKGTTYLENKDGVTLNTAPDLVAGTYDYFVSASRNGCESAKTKVTVTILPAPKAPVAATGNPLTTCLNTSVDLKVDAVAGVSVNWYDALTGGNLLATNTNTYSTPTNLGVGVHKFYVEAVNGNSCTSTEARTEITLTVNPAALASDIKVDGAATPFCVGTIATLTASSTTVTDPVFTWYSDPALTKAVHTGAEFKTDALTETTTYYVTVSGSNKCENGAADAKLVTLTVNPPSTAADIVIADQTVCPGSTVVLTPTSTTVTSPVFTFYSNADKTGPITTGVTANGVLTLNGLAPGTYTYYIAVSGTNKCENDANALKAVKVTVNEAATAADIDIADQTVCPGSTVVLSPTSTTVTNPVFTFYSNTDKTGPITTGVSDGVLTLNGLAPGVHTYYIAVSGSNKCENDAAVLKAVKVTVNESATAADIVIADQTVCPGSTVVLTPTSTTVDNPVFTFYSNADQTGPITTGVTANGVLTLNGLAPGVHTYYIAVSGSNKCENDANALKAVKVTVNAAATAADIVIADQTVCPGSPVVLTPTSTTVTSPVFTFYTNADQTGPITTGVTANGVLTLNGLAPGVHTYYIAVSGSNKCENDANALKAVKVTVNEAATAADIVIADQTVCPGSSVVLKPTSTTVTSPVFTFYTNADETGAITTGVSNGVLTLNGLTPGVHTYYIAVSGSNKCANDAGALKAVKVTVNEAATAADINIADQTVCPGSPVVLTPTSTTVTSPVFTFYSNADQTGPITAGVTANGVLTLNGLAPGVHTYYIAVSGSNKCANDAGALKAVKVTVNESATAADINIADQTVCPGSPVVLTPTSTTVTSPVFTFYSNADKTGPITTGVSNGVLTLNGLTPGVHTYYIAVSGSNKCANDAGALKAVKVTVNESATAADINIADQTVCSGSSVALAPTSTTVTSPVFTFYTNANKTGQIITGVSDGVLTLSGLTPGVHTYYIAVSGSNKCVNDANALKAVKVTVSRSAIATDIAVADQAICSGNPVTLEATSAIGNPVFNWYRNAALTDFAFTGPRFSVTGLTETTSYYVTVSGDGVCANASGMAKMVTVTVNATPVTPVVENSGQNICAGESTVLNIQNPQTGVIYQWYDAPTGGTLLSTGTGVSYTTIALNITTKFYVQAISAEGCASSSTRLTVTVTVNPKPLVPTVASDHVSVCAGSTAALMVSNPQTGITYNWYTSATGGTVQGTGENFTTPAIETTTAYYVEAASATCISASRTLVTVTPVSAPTAPDHVTVDNAQLCSGTTALLSVVNPDATLTYNWYAAATGGTALGTGTTYTTSSLAETTIFYVESVSATGCISDTRTPVTVNVLPVLSAPVVKVQTATATSVTFEWAPVAGATSYEISMDGGTTWKAPSSGASGTTHVVDGLKPLMQVTIQVRAKGTSDCQTSAATALTGTADNPLGNGIFVPNTFTPNGDGKNDIFYVYGNTIAKMKLRVYNQWGQFLYESLNIQSGWDGTYKGQVQPNGVYVYTLEVTFNDGTTTTKKGTITLLR